MPPKFYSKPKSTPLTQEEIEQRYEDIQDELEQVYEWKKEEEAKLEDPKSSPQKIAAAKRAMKKVARRINTVKGQIIYWKLRTEGQSHFKASLEMNEFWASCNEEAKEEQRKKDEEDLPDLLNSKLIII